MFLNILSFASVMNTIWGIVLALIILLAMITIHEFGHYLSGKRLNFKINEFAIGFGPALFKKKKKNGEIFSVRALPLGGYCAFEGEDGENTDPEAFNNKKPWKRIIVLISGALMNYLLSLILIVISYFSYGQLLLVTMKVDPLPEDSAITSEYVLHDKDIIIKAEGKNVYLTTDLITILKGKGVGEEVSFTVNRLFDDGRKIVDVKVKLRENVEVESVNDTDSVFKSLGISYSEGKGYEIYSTPYKFGFFETIGRAFKYSLKIAGTIFTVLGQLLTGKLGMSAFGGPVTTITTTAKIASYGFNQFLEIGAFIGVNLAVFNLLPLPALDGSKVVFCIIEWIRKKPVNRNVEAVIHFLGFIFLIGFALLADILKVF